MVSMHHDTKFKLCEFRNHGIYPKLISEVGRDIGLYYFTVSYVLRKVVGTKIFFFGDKRYECQGSQGRNTPNN